MSRPIYFLKRPGKHRATFALHSKHSDGSQPKVEHDQVTATNAAMKAGSLSRADADFQLSALVKGLNSQAKLRSEGQYVATEANVSMLQAYWEAEYTHRRCQKDKAWNRLRLALDDIGPVSLLADRNTLQQAVDQKNRGRPRRQRAIVSALNQLRIFHGAKGKLAADKKTLPEFRFLTEAELKSVLHYVEDAIDRALFGVLFGTGMRTGEAFAFPPNMHEQSVVTVKSQKLRDSTIAPTKNRKARTTIVLDCAQDAMRLWLASPGPRMRRYDLILKRAVEKAFPKNPAKWVTPHDLRHSFAVHLRRAGASISDIAELLGDGYQVAQDYYLNVAVDHDQARALLAKLKRA